MVPGPSQLLKLVRWFESLRWDVPETRPVSNTVQFIPPFRFQIWPSLSVSNLTPLPHSVIYVMCFWIRGMPRLPDKMVESCECTTAYNMLNRFINVSSPLVLSAILCCYFGSSSRFNLIRLAHIQTGCHGLLSKTCQPERLPLTYGSLELRNMTNPCESLFGFVI